MIEARAYQAEAIEIVRKAILNTGRALMVMATGLGKTLTSALVWRDGPVSGRGLFIVHNNGILVHAREEYTKVFPNKKTTVYNGVEKGDDGDIVFATFQTLARNLDKFNKKDFAWMVVDESHHSEATKWRPVVTHFQCVKLAMTATPNRMDLKDIRSLFGQEVVDLRLETAIAKGWLPPIDYRVLSDGIDDDKVATIVRELREKKSYSVKNINKQLFIQCRDEVIMGHIRALNLKTIVFCNNIHHAEQTARMMGEAATTYHSQKTDEYNAKVLADFKTGDVRYLVTVNSFNEGMNVPDAGAVVFLRTTESETIFRQQLGRGLRPGKPRLIVLDFVGNLERLRCIQKFVQTVEEEVSGPAKHKNKVFVSGRGFDFRFSEQLVNLLDALDQKAAAPTRKTLTFPTVSHWCHLRGDEQLSSAVSCAPCRTQIDHEQEGFKTAGYVSVGTIDPFGNRPSWCSVCARHLRWHGVTKQGATEHWLIGWGLYASVCCGWLYEAYYQRDLRYADIPDTLMRIWALARQVFDNAGQRRGICDIGTAMKRLGIEHDVEARRGNAIHVLLNLKKIHGFQLHNDNYAIYTESLSGLLRMTKSRRKAAIMRWVRTWHSGDGNLEKLAEQYGLK